MKRKVFLCLFILFFQLFTLDEVMAAESLPYELKKNLVVHTSFFEGELGFSSVAGNYDGQGISFGALQYNMGQKTLQKVLQEHIDRDFNGLKNIIGEDKAIILKEILRKPHRAQMEWARSITDPTDRNKKRLKSDWHQAFTRLGETQVNQKIQIELCNEFLDKAILFSKDINIKSTQGLAFFFDHTTHHWDFETKQTRPSHAKWKEIKRKVNNRGNIVEKEKLAITCSFVEVKPPRDGKRRRCLIQKGSGVYFYKPYDISSYGLSYTNHWR